tara:strand:- start:5165 stop:5686 length:522 start_codon:yes stop_codon:yes gene_type:complete
MKRDEISYIVFPSPLGKTGLASRQGKLINVSPYTKNSTTYQQALSSHYESPIKERSILFKDLIRQFNLYFNGVLETFTCQLDLSNGTTFQQTVWKAMRRIPYGQTRTYKWVAHSIGHPKAYRATGNAIGKNPFSIIIPCHRVVRENGNIGGYSNKISLKKYLLKLEKRNNGPI